LKITIALSITKIDCRDKIEQKNKNNVIKEENRQNQMQNLNSPFNDSMIKLTKKKIKTFDDGTFLETDAYMNKY